jgi:hypothetical protein
MSLIYRATSANNKVADISIEGPNNVVCVLIDKILKTESKIECRTLKQAERLVDDFLRIHKPY